MFHGLNLTINRLYTCGAKSAERLTSVLEVVGLRLPAVRKYNPHYLLT